MAKQKYGIIEPQKPKVEPRSLLVVDHIGKKLVVSRFGPGKYRDNLREMSRDHSCLPIYSHMTFRPATSSESISSLAYRFRKIGKPGIIDTTFLQVCYALRTQEGVFINLPTNAKGNPITNEKTLKHFLTNGRKINEIYLLDNDFGFAPYDSFKSGEQDSDEFARGGLARVLEHTEGIAKKLKAISSEKNYQYGVRVCEFNSVKRPDLGIVSLNTFWYIRHGNSLICVCDNYEQDWASKDYAFGVLNDERDKR